MTETARSNPLNLPEVSEELQVALVALGFAACAVMILHIVVTGGKVSVARSTRVERDAEGREVVAFDEEVHYGMSGDLARVMSKLMPRRPLA